jgi:hypothetical protein
MENGKTLEKRTVVTQEKKGMTARDMLLIGILLAAGAVLKFFVGSLFNVGMKPNFIIAMYCLIILLVRPRLYEAAIIGILAGAVCQFFPGQPYLNFVSELVGAVVMSLLIRIPMNVKKFSLHPIVATFLSTLASGFTFVGAMYLLYYAGADITPPRWASSWASSLARPRSTRSSCSFCTFHEPGAEKAVTKTQAVEVNHDPSDRSELSIQGCARFCADRHQPDH